MTFLPLLVQLRGRKALDDVQAVDFEFLNDGPQWEEGECFLRGHGADWTEVALMQANL